MNNMDEKSEQPQNDLNVNAPQYNQSLQGDSFFRHDQVLKYEEQQSGIIPDPYIKLEQDLTPGLNLKFELPASPLNISQHDQQHQDDETIVSTQHQEYQADISMASSNEYNGLYIFTISILTKKYLCDRED